MHYMKNERIKINNIDKASIRYLLFDSEKISSLFTNFRVLNLNLAVKIRLITLI